MLPHARNPVVLGMAVLLAGAFFSAPLHAQGRKRNPSSKVYVADVGGEAQIDTGDAIEDLNKRTVYTAQGTVIETKRPKTEAERNKYYSAMVYSNGTGAYFDADTRVEVRKFIQEPFNPTRNDMDVEPSISQTQAFVAHGLVGLCTSKLVAGSNMTYQTPNASVNIRGRKIVIEAQNDVTKISMLEGDSTVKAGATDLGGHILHAGEQAIIRSQADGQTEIQIQRIPPQETPMLEDKVTVACAAKKTVYFEEKARTTTTDRTGQDPQSSSDSGSGEVTAFYDDNGNGTAPPTDIVAVPVTPTELPTEFTVSNAVISASSGGPGG